MLYRSQKSTSINKHCLCRQRKWPCPDPWQVHVEGKQRTRGRVRRGGGQRGRVLRREAVPRTQGTEEEAQK